MFSEIDDVLININVGVWMDALSQAAYEHESKHEFKDAVRAEIDKYINGQAWDGSLQQSLLALRIEKGGYGESEEEQELRKMIDAALASASLPGHSVTVGTVVPMAGTCYPSKDGWIRLRVYKLARDGQIWRANDAVTNYLPRVPLQARPSGRTELELRDTYIAVIAVFWHPLHSDHDNAGAAGNSRTAAQAPR